MFLLIVFLPHCLVRNHLILLGVQRERIAVLSVALTMVQLVIFMPWVPTPLAFCGIFAWDTLIPDVLLICTRVLMVFRKCQSRWSLTLVPFVPKPSFTKLPGVPKTHVMLLSVVKASRLTLVSSFKS
jgi:hypothetical protein